MLFICSSSPIAVPAAPTGGLTGSLSLTAPFIIPGSGESVTSLTLSASLKVHAVLGESGWIVLSAEFAEMATESLKILNSLAGMNQETVSTKIYAVTGLDSSVVLRNELTGQISKSVAISNTLGDFAFAATHQIWSTLALTGAYGSLCIYQPESDAVIVRDTFKIYSDGTDITKYLRHAEIDLYGEMSVKADFAGHLSLPDELLVQINSENYLFQISKKRDTPEGTALYGKTPAAKREVFSFKHVMASELAASLDGSIIFAADDFMISGLHSDMNSIEAASFIAEISGNRSRTVNGNRSLVFSLSKNNPVYSPENIISWEKSYVKPEGTFTEVVYGQSSESITIEPSTRTANTSEKIVINIYLLTDTQIISNASLRKTASMIPVTVTEQVLFEDGAGALTKPSYKMLSPNVRASGKSVFVKDGSGIKEVTYVTLRNTYELSSASSGEFAVFAYMKNRALFIKGANGTKKTIHAPHLSDHVSAIKLAKSEYAENGEKLFLEIPHTNIINTTSGLNIKTMHGGGALTGVKINIETNPVRITDRLEVLQWQK